MGLDWDWEAPPGQASLPTSPTTPQGSQAHNHVLVWPAERQATSGAELQARSPAEHQAASPAELQA